MQQKLISATEAAALIKSGDDIIVGGSAGMGVAESILDALEQRFLETEAPRDLGVIHTTGVGAVSEKGLNHLAHKGMVRRVIGGNFGLQIPFMKELIVSNVIQAYNVPQGVMCQLYRAMAAGQPGVITHVGLHTYMDPRHEGGRMNNVTKDDRVELVELLGREWLFYRAPRANFALIRGTTADEDGNVSMEREAAALEALSIAQAVHNSGGTVVCQVQRLARRGTLNPKTIGVPGFLINYFVIDQDQMQNYAEPYDPSRSGETVRPLATIEPNPLDFRRVIARRGAFELASDAVFNLGVGVSAGIANVAAEEDIEDLVVLTVEAGPVGGIPGQGLYFGSSINPKAIMEQGYMFDFYAGGGLDVAFVSFAEVDAKGNVNVTCFGDRNDGAGGFIEITQNTKRIVFSGTFTGRGLKGDVGSGNLTITSEGSIQKFVPEVNQISYNASFGQERHQDIMFVTERAVLKMMPDGITVTELAPGVRLQEDVLDQMGFEPRVADEVKVMDPRIFSDGPMGLRKAILMNETG